MSTVRTAISSNRPSDGPFSINKCTEDGKVECFNHIVNMTSSVLFSSPYMVWNRSYQELKSDLAMYHSLLLSGIQKRPKIIDPQLDGSPRLKKPRHADEKERSTPFSEKSTIFPDSPNMENHYGTASRSKRTPTTDLSSDSPSDTPKSLVSGRIGRVSKANLAASSNGLDQTPPPVTVHKAGIDYWNHSDLRTLREGLIAAEKLELAAARGKDHEEGNGAEHPKESMLADLEAYSIMKSYTDGPGGRDWKWWFISERFFDGLRTAMGVRSKCIRLLDAIRRKGGANAAVLSVYTSGGPLVSGNAPTAVIVAAVNLALEGK